MPLIQSWGQSVATLGAASFAHWSNTAVSQSVLGAPRASSPPNHPNDPATAINKTVSPTRVARIRMESPLMTFLLRSLLATIRKQATKPLRYTFDLVNVLRTLNLHQFAYVDTGLTENSNYPLPHILLPGASSVNRASLFPPLLWPMGGLEGKLTRSKPWLTSRKYPLQAPLRVSLLKPPRHEVQQGRTARD